MKNSKDRKISIYIDGSNLYFSIKNTFHCKIDIEKFCKKFVVNNRLIKINYYTAPIEQFSNPKMYAEQQSFFEKIKKIDKLNIILGRLEKRKREGDIYYVEKASDVNLALDLALDAQKDIYDEAYLISNDGDFSGAVLAAKGFGKKVIYVAIGNRKVLSHHLKKVASQTFYVIEEFIKDCIL
ncbi:NYN domain-containing protein [Candidatus Woesearchaeota archaeon]|nr:NYN domain-containing protein [Candidatus Woesearchaeota archaeon]